MVRTECDGCVYRHFGDIPSFQEIGPLEREERGALFPLMGRKQHHRRLGLVASVEPVDKDCIGNVANARRGKLCLTACSLVVFALALCLAAEQISPCGYRKK